MASSIRYPQGGRDNVTLICTYKRNDGAMVLSRNGWGKTHKEALDHADSQLPTGTWVRSAISSPNTIYADTVNAGRQRSTPNRYRKYEGQKISVTHRRRTW